MNGRSYSMPLGMVFKKSYCSQCGAKLEKEKTHRVVTKEDKDYYRYHDAGTFPRRDYDVYDYRWKCPACEARISYHDQCVIAKIQKKNGKILLSPAEINADYKDFQQSTTKGVLVRGILFGVILSLLVALLTYVAGDKAPTDLRNAAILFAVLTAVAVIGTVKRHQGSYRFKYKRSYSYEKEMQLERLHTYSSHNKKLVDVADKCYCFYCKSSMNSSEITAYADGGQTAECPKCGMKAILPDSIEEPVDEEIVSEMNEYWF